MSERRIHLNKFKNPRLNHGHGVFRGNMGRQELEMHQKIEARRPFGSTFPPNFDRFREDDFNLSMSQWREPSPPFALRGPEIRGMYFTNQRTPHHPMAPYVRSLLPPPPRRDATIYTAKNNVTFDPPRLMPPMHCSNDISGARLKYPIKYPFAPRHNLASEHIDNPGIGSYSLRSAYPQNLSYSYYPAYGQCGSTSYIPSMPWTESGNNNYGTFEPADNQVTEDNYNYMQNNNEHVDASSGDAYTPRSDIIHYSMGHLYLIRSQMVSSNGQEKPSKNTIDSEIEQHLRALNIYNESKEDCFSGTFGTKNNPYYMSNTLAQRRVGHNHRLQQSLWPYTFGSIESQGQNQYQGQGYDMNYPYNLSPTGQMSEQYGDNSDSTSNSANYFQYM